MVYRSYLVSHACPSVHVCLRIRECRVLQLLARFVGPGRRHRFVGGVSEPPHGNIESGVGDTNIAIVLHHAVGLERQVKTYHIKGSPR